MLYVCVATILWKVTKIYQNVFDCKFPVNFRAYLSKILSVFIVCNNFGLIWEFFSSYLIINYYVFFYWKLEF